MAVALREHSASTIAAVQAFSVATLQQICGLAEPAARTLHDLAHGRDPRIPTPRPAPKVLSLQMTLTPVPLPELPGVQRKGKGGMLMPLLLGGDDVAPRMSQLLAVMLQDLLARVVEDRCVQHALLGLCV